MARRRPAIEPAPPLDTGAEALTGLRGAAAVLVMVHHFTLRDPASPAPLQTLFTHGYLAVDLFFVLSGFVMARAYGDWFRGGWRSGAGAYLTFMSRRVARLWPLHTAVVLVLLLIGTPTWPLMVATNLLMLQAWGFSQALNTPSWSVSTEMAAYALFPLLATVALHRGRGLAWAALAAAVLMLALATTGTDDGRRGLLDVHGNWSVLPLLRCVGGFTVGVLAYRASGWPAAAGLLRRRGLAAAALLALLAGMAWGVPDVVLYPLLPVLVVALQVGRGPLRTMLVSRPMRGLGALSYALYLVHYPILDAIPAGLAPAPARFVLFLAVSFAVAALAHVAIERPGRRALRLAGLAVGAQVGRALPG